MTEVGVQILGIDVYPSLDAVGEPIDLGIVSVHPKFVENILEDCGKIGMKGVIIFSAGFGEKNEEGKKTSLIITQ